MIGMTESTRQTSYVKWTQWIFMQLLKGLAYVEEKPVWFPSNGNRLANEEVLQSRRSPIRAGQPPDRPKTVGTAYHFADDSYPVWWAGLADSTAAGEWIGRSEGLGYPLE